MAQIILHERHTGNYRYVNCPGCKTEIQIQKPILLKMPYCGDCGKIVLDAAQKFCCWCGCEFEENP